MNKGFIQAQPSFAWGPNINDACHKHNRTISKDRGLIYLGLILSLVTINCYGVSRMQRESMLKKFFKDLPVLVTGGAGFIGSHVVEKLVELGAIVTVLDDLSSGSLDNLERVREVVTLEIGSITDFETCLKATRGKAVVFHLAAFISVPDSLQNPRRCYDVNVNGTLNLLEACRQNGVERFALSSSAAVYGSGHEICSEDAATKPESPYGASKLMDEILCQQYARNFGMKTICLRYFNVFGDRQNPNGAYAAVVAKFKHQMRNNLPVTIFGDGLQTRDFIHVTQVAEANLTLAMLEDESMTGEPYNIGTGKTVNLLELFDQLKKEFPAYHEPLVFAPARPGDIKYSKADCHKYYETIGH